MSPLRNAQSRNIRLDWDFAVAIEEGATIVRIGTMAGHHGRSPPAGSRRDGSGRTAARSYTQRIVQYCRKYGGFRPRLVSIGGAIGLVESLALAANEDAISILPAFVSHLNVPNVVLVPIADANATWDLFMVWQRGKVASALRTLLSDLNLKSQ